MIIRYEHRSNTVYNRDIFSVFTAHFFVCLSSRILLQVSDDGVEKGPSVNLQLCEGRCSRRTQLQF